MDSKPDLPSWTSLPAPLQDSDTDNDDTQFIESGTGKMTMKRKMAGVAPAPVVMMKIGPPRRAKKMVGETHKGKQNENEKERHANRTITARDILRSAHGLGHAVDESNNVPPTPSTAPDLFLPDDTPRSSKQIQKAPLSSFLGVVITKPPTLVRKHSEVVPQNGSQELVSALEQAFTYNKDALAVDEEKRPSGTTTTETYFRPLKRPNMAIGPRDVDAALCTQVAPLHVPRCGTSWSNLGEEKCARPLTVCLRHVEEGLAIVEVDAGPRVSAVAEKTRTRFFVERLNETFGPGSVHRGGTTKPKVSLSPFQEMQHIRIPIPGR